MNAAEIKLRATSWALAALVSDLLDAGGDYHQEGPQPRRLTGKAAKEQIAFGNALTAGNRRHAELVADLMGTEADTDTEAAEFHQAIQKLVTPSKGQQPRTFTLPDGKTLTWTPA